MHKTKIDWCNFTWNPVWGCLNHCPYCYARKTAERWGLSFEPHWRERNFIRAMPKEPARIFVNSMSEIVYWLPEWWERVIERIKETPRHTFIFLTQSPWIYRRYDLPMNCWLGATATDQEQVYARQLTLRDFKNICFLSVEPILEHINPNCVATEYIRWVILAAETGNRKERVVPPVEWIEPWLSLSIPLYMKHNLPWAGKWRCEYPAAATCAARGWQRE